MTSRWGSGDETAGELEPERLTTREIELLELAAQGMSRQEIGQQLNPSFNTIKSHYRKIFRKLGVSCRDDAVLVAARMDSRVAASMGSR